MNRTIISTLAAGFVAIAALGAPAQAGYKSHSHGHGHFHVQKHYSGHHKFHGYRHVYRGPVCLRHEWVHHYGHKKFVCVLWN